MDDFDHRNSACAAESGQGPGGRGRGHKTDHAVAERVFPLEYMLAVMRDETVPMVRADLVRQLGRTVSKADARAGRKHRR
jgi:hypothetical protein